MAFISFTREVLHDPHEHETDFADQSGVSHRVPWKQGALGLVKRVF